MIVALIRRRHVAAIGAADAAVGAGLMVVEAPHLRADAQRNLERILEAARAVFAEDGLDASVADVAERAGVGTATIFRRFPTKDDLVAAMLEHELEAIVAARAQAAGDATIRARRSASSWRRRSRRSSRTAASARRAAATSSTGRGCRSSSAR